MRQINEIGNLTEREARHAAIQRAKAIPHGSEQRQLVIRDRTAGYIVLTARAGLLPAMPDECDLVTSYHVDGLGRLAQDER